MTDRIRVLFLGANPHETDRLSLDEEARAISDAIHNNNERNSLDFRSEWAVRTGDLQRVLLQHRPQVLHFGGHGDASLGLIIGNEAGSAVSLDGRALAAVIRASVPPIHVVVLNACTSLPVTRRFRDVVDYTVGMKRPISDPAAIQFSATFYGTLAAGMTVEKAFEWAIARLTMDYPDAADIPRLLKRKGLETPTPPLLLLATESLPAPVPPAAPEPRPTTSINTKGNVGSIMTINNHGTTLNSYGER